MADRRQLTLDLPFRPAFGREDFFVADCNREALAFLDLWPNWPTPMAFLCGPTGCGKSHLAAVWQKQSGSAVQDQVKFSEAISLVDNDRRHFVVEFENAVADEQSLFHFYNRVAEVNGSILATATIAPARWNISLPDLASRLRTAPVLNIGMPDDALLEAVLIKLFSDRQLRVEPDVVGYLLKRMDRSLGAARKLVELLDDMALAQHRTISVPFARKILEAGLSQNESP
ncbi:MAG: hypothetical protein CMM52_04150 [Rhodospirillaceae bacterium]|nr:hypothetical protein [Rhodospirillaceae bacterium]|tara:strand:+ start:11243 stop:11929 length:687 start_codon:yes stop_codon:yes gene_type:complete